MELSGAWMIVDVLIHGGVFLEVWFTLEFFEILRILGWTTSKALMRVSGQDVAGGAPEADRGQPRG